MGKTIFWNVKNKIDYGYNIQFWAKKDRSDIIWFTTVSLDEEKLRNKIADIIGSVRFTLCHFKE